MSRRVAIDKPGADYAAYYAGHSQLKLGRHEPARKQFAALTSAKPAGYLLEGALWGEAEAAFASGDYAGAQRVYSRLLAGAPTAAPDVAWFRLGDAARRAGDRASAITAFTRVYEQFPLSRHAPDSMAALVSMRAIDPLASGNARYRMERKRAEAMLGAKRYADARAILERLRPHASGAERDRLDLWAASCSYFTKQYAAARAAVRPHRNAGPLQEESRFIDLMSARGLGQHDEFEQLATDFVRRFTNSRFSEDTLDALGTYYIQRDRHVDADAAFRRLLATFPTGRFTERAAWKVGWRAYREGNGLEAARVFEQAAAAFGRSDYRPAYLYWAGRARQSLGQHDLGDARYLLVRSDYLYSYYGRLADSALEGRDVPVLASFDTTRGASMPAGRDIGRATPPPTADVIQFLLSAGLSEDATREIGYAQQRWGDSPILQATLGWLEHQKGDLLAGARAVRRAYPQYLTVAGGDLPLDLATVIFPLGYWSLIRDHAARFDMDPYLVAALMAQESGFIPDIRSPAKATGLMQLMPGTAQRYAKKINITPYTPARLTHPDTNIRLGVAYFSDLLNEFGHAHLALASYNAGENRVRRWLAERKDLSPDEFIDDIPFPETQNYVKKILGSAENYRRIYAEGLATAADPNRAVPSLASRRSVAK